MHDDILKITLTTGFQLTTQKTVKRQRTHVNLFYGTLSEQRITEEKQSIISFSKLNDQCSG